MAAEARAQELKFGFVEDQRILSQLPEVKEVQKILDQETALWEKRFQDRQQAIKVWQDSLTTAKAQLKAVSDSAATPGAAPRAAQPPVAADSLTPVPAGRGVPADTLALRRQIGRLEERAEAAKQEVLALYRQIYGEGGVLERRNAELSQPILEKVNRMVAETGQRMGVSLIFDSSVLFYIDQELNLTDEVLQALGVEQSATRR